MIHSSSINVLVTDIVRLSKTLSILAEEIESAHMQELAMENVQTTEKDVKKKQPELQHQPEESSTPKEIPSGTESLNKEDKPVVTIEQVRAVLAEKSQAGLTSKVKELLESFGANKLSAVAAEDYEKLLAAAKDLK